MGCRTDSRETAVEQSGLCRPGRLDRVLTLGYPRSVAIADELRATVGGVTGVHRVAQGVPREAQVGGLVFYPLVGAAIGLAGVAALRLAAPLGPRLAAVIGLVVLAAA